MVTFRNEYDTDVALFWEGDRDRYEVASVPARGEFQQRSVAGQVFSYSAGGQRRTVQVVDDLVLMAPDVIRVACDELSILVHPGWSPRGAARFLELVRTGYFDGVAVHRAVPRFLAQFGIGKDLEAREHWRESPLRDDPHAGVPFRPGTLSFAGSGPDSRTSEVFVVLPDCPQIQLDAFGMEPWETPFGLVENVQGLAKILHNYGDSPPGGGGPDPHRVFYPNGYDYLAAHFPDLAYLGACRIDTQGVLEREDDGSTEEFVDLGPVDQHPPPRPASSDYEPPRTVLGAYGPPIIVVVLACSMDAMRRRARRIAQERAKAT